MESLSIFDREDAFVMLTSNNLIPLVANAPMSNISKYIITVREAKLQ